MTDRQFNLADLFELVVDTVPDRLALVAGDVRLTYAELDARADRFANHLLTTGIAPGAHVGILARNRSEWVEAMIGCYKSRTVPINLNFRYVAPELRYVIDNADLEVLVYERELSQLVADSRDEGSTRPLHLVVIEDGTPVADDDPVASDGAAPVPYEEALAAAPDGRLTAEPLPRRPVRPLHRRHHRYAQGRHVAAGGHLLRGHGRWRLGGRAHHVGR